MRLAVRGFLLLAVLAVVLGGARLRSSYRLLEEVDAFRTALRDDAIAPRRGLVGIPDEDDIRERVAALASEHDLTVVDLGITVERDVPPTGPAAALTRGLEGTAGRRDVDADGNLTAAPSVRLRATRITVRTRVRGEGFLCTVEEDAAATRQFEFALR